jgi:hypothetical protein
VELNTRHLRIELLNAFGDWVNNLAKQGYQPYLMTFLFNHIRGHPRWVSSKMLADVEHFHRTLLKWIVSNPRTAPIHPLPALIALPDRPIRKHLKQSLADVSINSGLHVHGIIAIPPRSRLTVELDEHVRAQYGTYTNPQYTRIRHIDVEKITSRPAYVTGYGLKALKNDPAVYDSLLILPKSTSEVPPRQRREHTQRGAHIVSSLENKLAQ